MRAGQRTDFKACLFVNLRQVGADRTFAVCSRDNDDGALRLELHAFFHFARAFQAHID